MKEYSKQDFISEKLLSLEEMMEKAQAASKGWSFGEALFCKEKNVKSEYEFKQNCKKNHKLSRHAAIGFHSYQETVASMKWIYEELKTRDCVLDRFGILLDAAMGVPSNMRDKVNVGTGLMLNSEEEWVGLGQAAPVMIHFGDNMIGSMNSIENLRLALLSGATSLGNFSQYFSYDYPFAYDLNKRTEDTCTAVCIMGLHKDRGLIMHSNLDDGFSAAFNDLAMVLGWAKMEQYLTEELMNARLGHCFGNLFSSSVLRIVFSLALDEIKGGNTCGTMIYGNTTDYTNDFVRNHSVMNGYLIGDMIGQIHHPTGHAMSSVPVSEAVRIPKREEILEAHIMSNEIEKYAKDLEPYMNWEKINEDKDFLVERGRMVFDNLYNGFSHMGIDMKNPAEIMMTAKKMGPALLERHFGIGELSEEYAHGRKPAWPTDMVKNLEDIQSRVFSKMDADSLELTGVKVVLAATDVHEFGKLIVGNVLKKAGVTVFDIGSDVNPNEVVEMALETGSSAILISTYNGIAKTFAKELLKEIKKYSLSVEVFMGGLLNENEEGGNIPVDVSQELKALGIHCVEDAERIPAEIKKTVLHN